MADKMYRTKFFRLFKALNRRQKCAIFCKGFLRICPQKAAKAILLPPLCIP
ncbi:hypothetical protein [Oscillospiraceae bacterium]|nr:hypothetical protein [Oscillospiraceae bacterium]